MKAAEFDRVASCERENLRQAWNAAVASDDRDAMNVLREQYLTVILAPIVAEDTAWQYPSPSAARPTE